MCSYTAWYLIEKDSVINEDSIKDILFSQINNDEYNSVFLVPSCDF